MVRSRVQKYSEYCLLEDLVVLLHFVSVRTSIELQLKKKSCEALYQRR